MSTRTWTKQDDLIVAKARKIVDLVRHDGPPRNAEIVAEIDRMLGLCREFVDAEALRRRNAGEKTDPAVACVTWWFDACQDQHFVKAPDHVPVPKAELGRLKVIEALWKSEHPESHDIVAPASALHLACVTIIAASRRCGKADVTLSDVEAFWSKLLQRLAEVRGK